MMRVSFIYVTIFLICTFSIGQASELEREIAQFYQSGDYQQTAVLVREQIEMLKQKGCPSCGEKTFTRA